MKGAATGATRGCRLSAIVLTVSFMTLAAANVFAQCVVSYQAETEFPIGFNPTDTRVKATGTVDCGVVRGTLCVSGTVSGDCISNTNAAYAVSCPGVCTAEFGGTPADVTCVGTPLWEGNVQGQCLSAVCKSDGTSSDGATSTHAVAVADPATLQAAFQDCSPTGMGVTHASYHGVTIIPLPNP